jgi:hypothetical protein
MRPGKGRAPHPAGRVGAPRLRGPRALEELALLLISTGELTADDLRLLRPRASSH